jgi:hypothetical protein
VIPSSFKEMTQALAKIMVNVRDSAALIERELNIAFRIVRLEANVSSGMLRLDEAYLAKSAVLCNVLG